MPKNMDVNLYAYGNAAENYDCEKGPLVIKNALAKTPYSAYFHWQDPLHVTHHDQKKASLKDVVALSKKLANSTHDSVKRHQFFITLGGDHSAAIGSWSGAAGAISGDMGLIWFDAHMDAHTFETTPSDNIHGMPLAVLLGVGEACLTTIGSDKPKVKPENLVLIGIRSYEKAEAELLAQLGVTIFFMDDVEKRGLASVTQSAIDIVTQNTLYFGVSIDLDGFDPSDAPGVGSPAPDGVCAVDFLNHFHLIAKHPQFIGMDIVEFNPVLDVDAKTEQLCVKIVDELMVVR